MLKNIADKVPWLISSLIDHKLYSEKNFRSYIHHLFCHIIENAEIQNRRLPDNPYQMMPLVLILCRISNGKKS